MIYTEKYTGDKTYMFPNGAFATPEVVLAKFPAILTFPHIIETDESGQVMFAVENLAAMRSLHNIDSSLNESQAIAAINTIKNTQPVQEISMEERTAAALEMIAINGMPDLV